jgi:hypothetical protein
VDLVNSLNIPFKTKIDSADAKFLVEESFTWTSTNLTYRRVMTSLVSY